MWLKVLPIIIALIGIAIEVVNLVDKKSVQTYKGTACVYRSVSAEKQLRAINVYSIMTFFIIVGIYSMAAFENTFRLFNIFKLKCNVLLIGALIIMVTLIAIKTIFHNHTIFKDIEAFENCIQENDISVRKLRGNTANYWVIIIIMMLVFVLIAYFIKREYIYEWWTLGILIGIAGESVYYSFAKEYFEIRYVYIVKKVEIKIEGIDHLITGIKEYQMNNNMLSILYNNTDGEIIELIVPQEQIKYIKKVANKNALIIDLIREKLTKD